MYLEEDIYKTLGLVISVLVILVFGLVALMFQPREDHAQKCFKELHEKLTSKNGLTITVQVCRTPA